MRSFPKKLRPLFTICKNLRTPQQIQDFINTIPINFEKSGDTCYSPLSVLHHNKAHCMEGALFAAATLWFHGYPPLLLDLKTTDKDESHVVTLFKQRGRWGAVSKTNHAVLRYRDPVYTTIRELTLSYFHEYFLNNGEKTLRSYAGPFDLLRYDDKWLTTKKPLWHMVNALDRSPHMSIAGKAILQNLRKAEDIEIQAGKLTEWKK